MLVVLIEVKPKQKGHINFNLQITGDTGFTNKCCIILINMNIFYLLFIRNGG